MGDRLKTEVKRPAVFLDRDGTLIEQVDDITSSTQMRVLPGVPEALRRLRNRGYALVVVTNQPVIGKGLVSVGAVRDMNAALNAQLGGAIEAFYVCPHRYADACDCRKPELALLAAAAADLNLDIAASFVIGDDRRDVEFGKRAGCRTILVQTGHAGCDVRFFKTEPDIVAADLSAAASRIENLQLPERVIPYSG